MIAMPRKNIKLKQIVSYFQRLAVHLGLCTVLVPLLVFSPQSWADNTLQQHIIQLTEKGTDVFYLSARLGVGDTIELMLDTGSGYLAINQNLLAELKKRQMASYQRSINARLANGAVKKVAIYQIAQLHLGEGCTLYNVDAAILSGNSRNILGLNILKQMESFSVAFDPPQLILNGCEKANQLVQASL